MAQSNFKFMEAKIQAALAPKTSIRCISLRLPSRVEAAKTNAQHPPLSGARGEVGAQD